MENSKKWYQSLAVNSSAAGAIVSLASIASVVSNQPAIVPIAQTIVDQGLPLLTAAGTFITSMAALIGRMRANTRIG